jgi:hypothetical protein
MDTKEPKVSVDQKTSVIPLDGRHLKRSMLTIMIDIPNEIIKTPELIISVLF